MRLPSEPCRHTCPDINRLQKTIKEIRNNFSSFKDTDSITDFLSTMEDTSWELKCISDTLEELRNSNSSLRDWGNELTSIAENIESDYEKQIEKLETIIENKDGEISSLEDDVTYWKDTIAHLNEYL